MDFAAKGDIRHNIDEVKKFAKENGELTGKFRKTFCISKEWFNTLLERKLLLLVLH